jgi:hypothetical protein
MNMPLSIAPLIRLSPHSGLSLVRHAPILYGQRTCQWRSATTDIPNRRS